MDNKLQIHNKFEYKVLDIPAGNATSIEKKLNDLGKDNWELIGIFEKKFIFKRFVNIIK